MLFRESTLGAHIKDAPWTDMSGFSWKDARFGEYRNTGSGAGVNSNRPQLADANAPSYTADGTSPALTAGIRSARPQPRAVMSDPRRS